MPLVSSNHIVKIDFFLKKEEEDRLKIKYRKYPSLFCFIHIYKYPYTIECGLISLRIQRLLSRQLSY